jgi:hypothetical protein
MITELDWSDLPLGEAMKQGLHDVEHGIESVEAQLVWIGRYRMMDVGLVVPLPPPSPISAEERLYYLLGETEAEPYGRYNSLKRQLTSFLRALDQVARQQRLQAVANPQNSEAP